MGISFGKNRKIKIKVNKSPSSDVDNNNSKQSETELSAEMIPFQPKSIDKPVSKKDKLTQENLWQNFFERLSNTYNIVSISVYTCELLDMYRFIKIYGDTVQSTIVLEKYFSLGTTTVISNATGLTEDKNIKSRFITNLQCNDQQYLLVLSSRAYETFTNGYTAENITVLAKDTVRKIGELL